MKTLKKAQKQMKDFIDSDDFSMILNGTHQYDKHRQIMLILDSLYSDKKILFRTNALKNLMNNKFWGLKKQPKSNEWFKYGNNYYMFDTFNDISTKAYEGNNFDFGIVYPIDAILRDTVNENKLNDLFEGYGFNKLFLITCNDKGLHQQSNLYKKVDRIVTYNVEENDPDYHERVLERY